MTVSLNHKYKDRNPIDTINIIYTFFINQGYQIEIIDNIQTEANTFWCHINLKDKDNNIILGTNGKGTTNEYSLASGFGELYERYCAGFHLKNFNENKFLNKKLLNYEEISNSCNVIKHFFQTFDSDKQFFKFLLNFYNKNESNDKVPCNPYFNLNNYQDKLYLNFQIINKIMGSNGLAAGNTIEEAIVQGLSEVYEHYITDKLYYKNNKKQIYYELNLDFLKNNLSNHLKDIIYKIEKYNYILKIYDLSYNFNLPVLLSIIITPNHTIFLNVGSHPVFEIALERTLTELYQGRISFNEIHSKQYLLPYRNFSLENSIFECYSSITERNNYPEEILINSQSINQYNTKIFLNNQNFSNTDLISYFIKLNKKNDLDIYIQDLSQNCEMKTVRVFCSNQIIFPWRYTICNQINKNIKSKLIQLLLQLQQEKKYTNRYIQLLEKIEKISLQVENKNALTQLFLFFTYSTDTIFPIQTLDNFFNFYEKKLKKSFFISQITWENFIYFKTIYEYKKNNNYTDEEIFIILSKGFNYKNKRKLNNDIQNILNKKYLLKNIFKT